MSYHSNITRGKSILLRQQRWIPIPECLLDNKLMKASEENRDLMNREFEMAVSKTDVTKKICRWLSCDKVWWVRIGLGPATSWAARVGICWHRETSETCQPGNQRNLRRQPGNPEPESVRVSHRDSGHAEHGLAAKQILAQVRRQDKTNGERKRKDWCRHFAPHTSFFSCSLHNSFDAHHTALAQVSASARHPIFMPTMVSGWLLRLFFVSDSLRVSLPSPCSSLPTSTCTLTWTPPSTTPRQFFPCASANWGVVPRGDFQSSHRLWAQRTWRVPLLGDYWNDLPGGIRATKIRSPRTCVTRNSTMRPSGKRYRHHCSFRSEENQRTEDKLITLVKKVCCQLSPFSHTQERWDPCTNIVRAEKKPSREMENENNQDSPWNTKRANSRWFQSRDSETWISSRFWWEKYPGIEGN